jgi:hypothetical protein
MGHSGAQAVWQRADGVAFTDDGQRVVALLLRHATRPRLMEGSAAAIWRALDRPRVTKEVAAVALGGSTEGLARATEDTQGFLEGLSAEGLVVRSEAG